MLTWEPPETISESHWWFKDYCKDRYEGTWLSPSSCCRLQTAQRTRPWASTQWSQQNVSVCCGASDPQSKARLVQRSPNYLPIDALRLQALPTSSSSLLATTGFFTGAGTGLGGGAAGLAGAGLGAAGAAALGAIPKNPVPWGLAAGTGAVLAGAGAGALMVLKGQKYMMRHRPTT